MYSTDGPQQSRRYNPFPQKQWQENDQQDI